MKFGTYIPVMTPTRKLIQDTNFRHSKIIRHFGPENPQNWTQKDMNFGKPKIICHFGPENPQNPTQKDMNFEKMHSLTPAKNAHKIRKVFVFPEFSTLCTFIQMHSLTPPNTNQLTTLGIPSNTIFKFCRPIVIHSDSSTLAQDAVLNCYKRPAHNDYQLLIFQRPISSCVVF